MRKRGKGRKVELGTKMKEQTLQNEGDGLRRVEAELRKEETGLLITISTKCSNAHIYFKCQRPVAAEGIMGHVGQDQR